MPVSPTASTRSGRGWPLGRTAIGVALHVAISLVVAGTARALMGQDLVSSWLWLPASLVALGGALVGALVASWGRTDGPVVGAVTATLGAAVLAVVTATRRLGAHQGLPVANLLAVVAIQVALGLAGGVLGRHFGPD